MISPLTVEHSLKNLNPLLFAFPLFLFCKMLGEAANLFYWICISSLSLSPSLVCVNFVAPPLFSPSSPVVNSLSLENQIYFCFNIDIIFLILFCSHILSCLFHFFAQIWERVWENPSIPMALVRHFQFIRFCCHNKRILFFHFKFSVLYCLRT